MEQKKALEGLTRAFQTKVNLNYENNSRKTFINSLSNITNSYIFT